MASQPVFCELCGDERLEEDLNEELRCPPCEEREERNEGEHCKGGHSFEYAYDLNYNVPFNPMLDQSAHVISIADIYRCTRCGAIDTVE